MMMASVVEARPKPASEFTHVFDNPIGLRYAQAVGASRQAANECGGTGSALWRGGNVGASGGRSCVSYHVQGAMGELAMMTLSGQRVQEQRQYLDFGLRSARKGTDELQDIVFTYEGGGGDDAEASKAPAYPPIRCDVKCRLSVRARREWERTDLVVDMYKITSPSKPDVFALVELVMPAGAEQLHWHDPDEFVRQCLPPGTGTPGTGAGQSPPPVVFFHGFIRTPTILDLVRTGDAWVANGSAGKPDSGKVYIPVRFLRAPPIDWEQFRAPFAGIRRAAWYHFVATQLP
jgi:hypothetical protein